MAQGVVTTNMATRQRARALALQLSLWLGIGACYARASASNGAAVGSARLAISLAGGVEIDAISYEVTGDGITPLTGTIPTPAPAASVSVFLTGLPAGAGYGSTLTAVSRDGGTTCTLEDRSLTPALNPPCSRNRAPS
jgi:hypothetical protein